MAPTVVYSSEEERRRWNSLSEKMAAYHQWFKDEFAIIYECADGSYTRHGLSLRLYFDTVDRFISGLTMHHTVEERYVFPILAKHLPQFADHGEDGHIGSHEAIHTGLEKLSGLISEWRKNSTTYSPAKMTGCLDELKGVLFDHLDQEVSDIKGDCLKPYFDLEEIDAIGR